MTDAAIDDLARKGIAATGTRTVLARVGIGVAVREGAALPDISTPEALKQTLLAAKSLVYVDPAKGGTSGIHFAGVLQRLGIAEAVKGKTTLLPGGYVVELVAKGEIELGVHQISEILAVKGVRLVGPLPRELQKITIFTLKSIRLKLGTSQSEFALMIGVSLATLQNWEQGRRMPEGPARALLKPVSRFSVEEHQHRILGAMAVRSSLRVGAR